MRTFPDHWREVPLAQINTFTSKTVDPASLPHQKFELYSVPSFPSKRPETAYGGAIGSTKQVVAPNDVLVCKINPRINRVWQVGAASDLPQIASSEWIVVRAPEFDARFLQRYFSGPEFRDLLCQDLTGVGGSLTRAQPKRVASLPVPVPPFDEQKRIAEKLDTLLVRVDACRDRLDRVPAILKRFRQSVLLAATMGQLTGSSNGAENLDLQQSATPSNWRHTSVGAVTLDLRYGTSKKCNYQAAGLGVLRIPNIADHGRIDTSDLKRTEFDVDEIAKLSLHVGDLLVIRSNGSVELVGRTGEVTSNEQGLLFAGYLMRLRVNQAVAYPAFIRLWLAAPAQREYIERTAKSTSGVNNLNAEELRAVPLALPPLREQREIVDRVNALLALSDRLEERFNIARQKVERLTPSALAKAFRGELVPQDPNDEPAAALLERIRQARQAAPAVRSTRAIGRPRQKAV